MWQKTLLLVTVLCIVAVHRGVVSDSASSTSASDGHSPASSLRSHTMLLRGAQSRRGKAEGILPSSSSGKSHRPTQRQLDDAKKEALATRRAGEGLGKRLGSGGVQRGYTRLGRVGAVVLLQGSNSLAERGVSLVRNMLGTTSVRRVTLVAPRKHRRTLDAVARAKPFIKTLWFEDLVEDAKRRGVMYVV